MFAKPQDLGLCLLPPLLTRKNIEVAETSSTDISADDAMKYQSFIWLLRFTRSLPLTSKSLSTSQAMQQQHTEAAPAIAAATGYSCWNNYAGSLLERVTSRCFSRYLRGLRFVGIFSGIVGLLIFGIKLPGTSTFSRDLPFGIAYALTTVSSPLLVPSRCLWQKDSSYLLKIAGEAAHEKRTKTRCA